MALFSIKAALSTLTFIIFLLPTAATSQTSSKDATRDVEFGSGGNIKLEKPYRTKTEDEYELHAHILLESRYVTEGRDNLAGNGIYSASTEFEYKGINIVPWIADAVDADYSEFNLNFVYGARLFDNMEVFAGYNHIQSRESGVSASDNEVSLGLVYFYKKALQVLANSYHSFEAGGAFTEVAIKKGVRINDRLKVGGLAILGFNSGYVADGHKGINHGQLLARAAYQAVDHLELYAYTGYNKPIDRDINRYTGDKLLRDFFWAGAGLSYRF